MARLRNKQEQREYIGPRARELAESGNFQNWQEIEHHLRYEEFCLEVRHVLDNERIQKKSKSTVQEITEGSTYIRKFQRYAYGKINLHRKFESVLFCRHDVISY